MLRRWQHVGGLVAATTGTVFATSFGGLVGVALGYSLAAALGAVLYVQGESFAAAGPISGNVLLGYLGGVLLSLGAATALLVWYFSAPIDFAAWQMGLLLWDSWAGVGVAVLSGFFVAGMAAMLY